MAYTEVAVYIVRSTFFFCVLIGGRRFGFGYLWKEEAVIGFEYECVLDGIGVLWCCLRGSL